MRIVPPRLGLFVVTSVVTSLVACANGTETSGDGGYTYTAASEPASSGGQEPTVGTGGAISGGTTGGGTTGGGTTGVVSTAGNTGSGVTVAAAGSTFCIGADAQNKLLLVACAGDALRVTLVQGQWRVGSKCLDLADATAPDNTSVVLNTCSAQPSQLWTYDRGYLFATNAPGASKCVYLSAGATAGSALQLRSCDISGQLWNVAPEGMQLMASAGSNRCLAVQGAGTANGTAVQVVPCDGSNGQLWTLESGQLRALKLGQKCLDLPNDQATAKAPLQIYDCDGLAQQTWFWEGTDGSLRAGGVADRCVRLGTATSSAATPAVVDTCATAQDWALSKP